MPMESDGISPSVREECYKRDGHVCTNPKCIFKDQVETLSDGTTRWKNKHWSTISEKWVQNALHLHHCYWRSRYRGSDRDQAWNLTTLCTQCHNLLHSPHPAIVSWSKELEQWCIDLAASRRKELGMLPVDYSRNDERFKARKFMSTAKRYKHDKEKQGQYHKNYVRRKQFFMEKNGGLTPLQVKYRARKGIAK